jgi:hypothetical protein
MASGAALLLDVGGALHLVASRDDATWAEVPLTGRDRRTPPGPLECAQPGGAALAVLDGAPVVALRCGQRVTLLRVEPGLASARALPVEGNTVSTRELAFARGGEGADELLLSAGYGFVHLAERGGGRLRLHAVEAATLEGQGAALALAPIERGASAPPAPQEPASPASASCPQGQSRCDGQCVDLQTDVDHCGACGQLCLSGACFRGRCEPPCFSQDDCDPAPPQGATAVGGQTHLCVVAGSLRGGARLAERCQDGRNVNSCGDCSRDETCTQTPSGLPCCRAATCRRDRDCADPRSRCRAPTGGGPRRCVRAGHCELPSNLPGGPRP